MEYIKRLVEEKFLKANSLYPIILVEGPRQVGKTTMLKKLSSDENRTYVTLDNMIDRELAINDPALFFQKYKTPILIDEIQYAPQLFPYIKMMADAHQINGEFWLTGSQSFQIMADVSESMAGRISIIHMSPMLHEEITRTMHPLPNDFSFSTLQKIDNSNILDLPSVFDFIYHGGMPKTIGMDEDARTEYFDNYVNTYLMKDAMELGNISDTMAFRKFLECAATQNANIVNYANLSRVADISQPTAKKWLSILEGLGLVYLLQPYYKNNLKRLTRSPKLYFFDTGLCAYLAKIPSKDTLMNSVFAGAYFENFVMNQIKIKNPLYKPRRNFFFYRDIDQNEVDILLEDEKGLTPLEVKLSAHPNFHDLNKFKSLRSMKTKISEGGIICLADSLTPASSSDSIIPVGLL